MSWIHEQCIANKSFVLVRQRESDELVTDDATLELLSVCTGKSRVFSGYQAELSLPAQPVQMVIRSAVCSSRLASVRNLADTALAQGLVFRAAGLEPGFSQSGLSWETEWGYLDDDRARISMLDGPPYRDDGHAVDRMGRPFGLTLENPVATRSVADSQRYMDSLFGPLRPVRWHRMGSVCRPRDPAGGIVDCYSVMLDDSSEIVIYLCPYRSYNTKRPPATDSLTFHLQSFDG